MPIPIFVIIAAAIAAVALSYILMPKPKAPKPPSLEDYSNPTAEAGRPIPVVFGTITVKGLNVLWYGDKRIRTSDKGTVNRYHMSQHFGVCLGADEISRIIIKEKTAWQGSVSAFGSFTINKQNLFGGKEKEGGVAGIVHYLPGAADQVLPDLLAQKMGRADGNDCPAYRGMLSLFFRGEPDTQLTGSSKGFYWGANSPYLPGVWVTVRRAPTGLDTGPPVSIDFKNGDYSINGASKTLEECVEAGSHTFGYADIVDGVGLLSANSVGGVDQTVPYLTAEAFAAVTAAGTAAGFTAVMTFVFDVEAADGESFINVEYVDPGGPTTGHFYAPWHAVPDGDLSLIGDYDALLETAPSVGGNGTHTAAFTFSGTRLAVSVNGGAPLVTATPQANAATLIRMYCQSVRTTGPGDVNTVIERIDFIATVEDSELQALSAGGALPVASGMIAADANPAHIIYECLTNVDWGMGSPAAAIDGDSFAEAAGTLTAEIFGISLIWTQQSSIQDFIQEVLDHIQAVLFVDPSTGLLTLKLIRGDYDESTLDVISPDNAELTNFGRKLWGDITNEIVVTWTNPENEQDETVTVQDLASIATQGGIVSDGRNYHGVRNKELAGRLSQRDLRSSGAPLASCDAEVDRTQWRVRPASVRKVTWPEHGLNELVMRVIDVDYGKPGDPIIKISLLEDVFGLDVGDYVVPPGTIFEDPGEEPAAATIQRATTLPYYFAVKSPAADYVDSPAYPEVVAGVLGTTTQEDAYQFELWEEVVQPDASLEWEQIGSLNVLGHATLENALAAEATTAGATFLTLIGDTSPTVAGFVLIGDEDEDGSEIAMITDNASGYDLQRGVMDTIPRAWPADTPVWFVDSDALFEDALVRSSGETAEYKLLTSTSQGLLDLADATLLSYELSDRPWQPNRPANVQVDGVLFNALGTPVDMIARPDPWVTVDWSNRNRLLEDVSVLAWDDATQAPETGQTTIVTVLAADGTTVLATHDGLSGTSFDVPDVSFGLESVVLLQVSAERTDADGTFASLQAHGIWVQVALTGDRITEDGDDRITEDGDRLIYEG